MGLANLANRFEHVKYDAESVALSQHFKACFDDLASSVEFKLDGRARALALTHLEEAYMWVGKAIRDKQLERTLNAEANADA